MSCSRSCKKTGIAAFAVFIAINALEFLIHSVLLSGVYQHRWYANLWNSPEAFKERMPWMYIGNAIFAAAFAMVYDRGFEEGKPALGQGIRYGFWIGLLAPVQMAIHNYFVYPVSIRLAGVWAASGLVECLIFGAIVALITGEASHQH